MITDGTLFHHEWTDRVQNDPPRTALESPLLALHHSSDVDPLLPDQISDVRRVLLLRREWLAAGRPSGEPADELRRLRRRVVERFLAGRKAHFGAEQCRPLEDAPALAREGRDVFLVIKFMDEEPHLAATVHSLLGQRDIDLGRVVIVAVDNNSTDGSDQIIKSFIAANRTTARIVYLNQSTPGAGNAARLGVDRCIATIHQMCVLDGDWDRLETAVIGVSDGDTVYHPHVVREMRGIFDGSPTVDGAMPFLTYKFTAALRLFADYVPASPEDLARCADTASAAPVEVDLAGPTAFNELPRWQRRYVGENVMELGQSRGAVVRVELASEDQHGRRFGVLRDPAGRIAYVLSDRTLVLPKAPVSGFDSALVFLENSGVRRSEKWRWHAVLGHDLFLRWAFEGMGLPEEVIFPDTSDALKMFRAWAFAIGGQHQLRRPGLRIATGSDYQSGRILQATGCTVRLGSATAYAETEVDRLLKMARNLAQRQAVFYGETRGSALERATGLYVHMTRIQQDIESELRGYDDSTFEQVVFPERVLFPLRWILQNAVRFYAHEAPQAKSMVRERVLGVMFSAEAAARVERDWFGPEQVRAVREAHSDDRLDLAERIAEKIIAEHYAEIMTFYQATLRDFFDRWHVAREHYEWLLADVTQSRNAIVEKPPAVDPTEVWAGDEFVIDVARGQVVSMRKQPGDVR
jgi:hypothetical protein